MAIKRYAQKIALASILLWSMGCSENESPDDDSIRLLTNNDTKNWTIISIESDDPVNGVDCGSDDILTLKLFDDTLETPGPSFYNYEGLVRCDFDEYYLGESGSWRLNNVKTRIILTTIFDDGFRVNNQADILQLSERKLVLRYREESDLRITYTTYTYESL